MAAAVGRSWKSGALEGLEVALRYGIPKGTFASTARHLHLGTGWWKVLHDLLLPYRSTLADRLHAMFVLYQEVPVISIFNLS